MAKAFFHLGTSSGLDIKSPRVKRRHPEVQPLGNDIQTISPVDAHTSECHRVSSMVESQISGCRIHR